MAERARSEVVLDDNPDEARAQVEALGVGDTLVLVGDDVRSVIDELEEEEPGRFEWSWLANDPRERLLVRRRADAAPRTVTDFLQRDHRRLDEILPVVDRLVEAGAFDEARARHAEFVCGLDWHIDVEEQVLFPYFEAKTGMKAGPTGVMRGEHTDIRASMKRVDSALDARDAALFVSALGELTTILASHNLKEERMLYPMTDRAIDTVDAQERFVRRLAKF